jgi:glucokinase
MDILAGDIGGTKTNLALFSSNNGSPGELVDMQSFASAQYDSLESCLREFLAGQEHRPTRAAFGVAGPVVGNRVETPNLPWVVEACSVAGLLGLERVRLVNDLEAMAIGIEALGPEHLYAVNEGDTTRGGNRALIAAGTGCGMAGIVRYDGTYLPVPSEGGHIDFAFLRGTGYAEEPGWLADEMEAGDAAAAISKAALAGSCALAEKALDMFVSIYGAMAGNLALMFVATGGLYVGGGIAPKILDKISDGTFMGSFVAKGRFQPLLESMPVRVILDDKTGLYGAAIAAGQ